MFFCLLLFKGTVTSFFKEKVKKKSQNSRIQGFPNYICLIQIRIQIQEAQKHTDPYPQATLDIRVRREMVLIFCFHIRIHHYFVRIHTVQNIHLIEWHSSGLWGWATVGVGVG
jgi:hypothetical protein